MTGRDRTPRLRLEVLALIAVAATLGACSRGEGLRCADDRNYAASRTAPPVRVPDGLTVPDESDALTIPPAGSPAERETVPEGRCLEQPPDYFEGGEPQGAR